jgi:host factor-I protein
VVDRFRQKILKIEYWRFHTNLELRWGSAQSDKNHNNNEKRLYSMSTEKAQNVQDVFLNAIRKNKTPVTVFLVNGVKLQGIVTWFDQFSMLLRRDGHTQLVYKHAISTVMPAAPVQLFEPKEEGGTGEVAQ